MPHFLCRQNKTDNIVTLRHFGLAKRIPQALLLFVLLAFLTACKSEIPSLEEPLFLEADSSEPDSAEPIAMEDESAETNFEGVDSSESDVSKTESGEKGSSESDVSKTEFGEEDSAETDSSEPVVSETEPEDDYSNGSIDTTDESFPEVKLLINEILPTNTTYLKHNGGYFDAVEILNASEIPVDLSQYFLSDSARHRTDYVLPSIVLQPGELTVVFCTGLYDMKTEIDLPFRLSGFGEKLYLADSQGNIIDKVEYPEMPPNVSYSRTEEGHYTFCTSPTPGSPNTVGFRYISAKPNTLPIAGFYNESQQIVFTNQGEIHYTLDGSKPTMKSPVWDGTPVIIDKTCSVRAFTHTADGMDSFDYTFNYYICEPKFELDVCSVSISPEDFATMNANYSSNRKYAANISLFIDGRQQFSVDCGISVFGCTSRAYDKKSYQLSFSPKFGPSKLRYRLFDGLDIDKFDSIVLRSGSQDNSAAMLRDEFVSSLVVSTGEVGNVLVQAYRPVNLYINGEYWGIYFIREHIDENMIASHRKCDPEQITLVEQTDEVKYGSAGREWRQLWNYVKDNRLTDEVAYDYVSSMVDLESVADYYIIQMWCGNHDLDNVREYQAEDGKWRYILYDLDLTLSSSAEGSAKYILGKFNPGLYTLNALVYRLLENEDFMNLFLSRLELLSANVLSSEYSAEFLDRLASRLEHDMEYNCNRWSGKDSSGKLNYRNYEGWKQSVDYLRSLLNDRCEIIYEEFCILEGIDIADSEEEQQETACEERAR